MVISKYGTKDRERCKLDSLCFVIECKLSLESARDIGMTGIMGRLCTLMSSPSFTSYESPSALPSKERLVNKSNNQLMKRA